MKPKNFFIIGMLMLVVFVAYILLGGFVTELSLWHYKVTWILFYVYSAVMIIAFLWYTTLKSRDLIKKADSSRIASLAGALGGVGCALFTFGICFVWYAANRPHMGTPFNLSSETIRLVYNSYVIITLILLISAAILKVVAWANKLRKSKMITE